MKSPASIATYRTPLIERLGAFTRQQRRVANGSAWQTDVIDRLDSFLSGGKLLRGSLICYSYAICGGHEADNASAATLPSFVLDAAAVIELIHASLLIHDDVIDQDELRRGQLAIHRQYRDLATEQHLDESHAIGANLALCAGDMILFMAFGLLARVQAETGGKSDLTELFTRELAIVCDGQMQDIHLGALTKPPSKRQIYAVMRAKTAAYSVALPLATGSILAGQPAATRQQLYAIGMAAGTIFQIRDDELGTLGLSADIGKPVGSDIREGKKTLLYYYLWQIAKPSERQRLTHIFGNSDAQPADIRYIQQELRRNNIPSRLQQDIEVLERTAIGHIGRLKLSRQAQDELHQLVRFCADRKL